MTPDITREASANQDTLTANSRQTMSCENVIPPLQHHETKRALRQKNTWHHRTPGGMLIFFCVSFQGDATLEQYQSWRCLFACCLKLATKTFPYLFSAIAHTPIRPSVAQSYLVKRLDGGVKRIQMSFDKNISCGSWPYVATGKIPSNRNVRVSTG